VVIIKTFYNFKKVLRYSKKFRFQQIVKRNKISMDFDGLFRDFLTLKSVYQHHEISMDSHFLFVFCFYISLISFPFFSCPSIKYVSYVTSSLQFSQFVIPCIFLSMQNTKCDSQLSCNNFLELLYYCLIHANYLWNEIQYQTIITVSVMLRKTLQSKLNFFWKKTNKHHITTKKTKISEGYLVRENVKFLSNSVTKFCDQGICEEFHFFRH